MRCGEWLPRGGCVCPSPRPPLLLSVFPECSQARGPDQEPRPVHSCSHHFLPRVSHPSLRPAWCDQLTLPETGLYSCPFQACVTVPCSMDSTSLPGNQRPLKLGPAIWWPFAQVHAPREHILENLPPAGVHKFREECGSDSATTGGGAGWRGMPGRLRGRRSLERDQEGHTEMGRWGCRELPKPREEQVQTLAGSAGQTSSGAEAVKSGPRQVLSRELL